MGLWDNQFALPVFAPTFSCQSVTLSAQRCISLIHSTVCLVSVGHRLHLSVPPLAVTISRVHFCDLAWPLSSLFTLPISGLFQLFVQFWPSSGPSGAGRALLALTAPRREESKNFRSRNFRLVPLAQGYRCLVAACLPFGRVLLLFLADTAGQSCQSKLTPGCQKLNPLFCGLWRSALFFGSKTENGHSNQIYWGDLSWADGDVRKPPPQPMLSIIASCISESRIFLFRNQFSFSPNPLSFRLMGGLLTAVPLYG